MNFTSSCSYRELTIPATCNTENVTNCIGLMTTGFTFVDLPNSTNLSQFNRSDLVKIQTGETVRVSLTRNPERTVICDNVTTNGVVCNSCSFCGEFGVAVQGSDTILLPAVGLSADCSNVPRGRSAVCEPFGPTFYPMEVRVFEACHIHGFDLAPNTFSCHASKAQ